MPNNKLLATYKCIYCLLDKPKSDFNREHVLQKSFGKFQGALTLIEQVCKDCNSSFGNEIDRILGRDSFEALYRLRYGMKSEIDDIPYKRLTLTIPKEEQSDWAGVKVEIIGLDQNLLIVRRLPQFGFISKSTGDYVYFTLSEIENGLQLDKLDLDKEADGKIISNTSEEWEKLTSFLNNNGLKYELLRDFSPIQPIKDEDNKLKLHAELNIDDFLVRGIAKIGFNYMAKMCGSLFATKDCFNDIRDFIRYNKLPIRDLSTTIKPTNQPLLANDSFNYRRLGHILALEWDITGRHVLARVSLFNSITWTIILAEYFSGIYREIKCCHFYDIQKHSIKELRVFSRNLLP